MISRNFLVIIWAAFLSCLSLTVQGSEPASPQESTEPPTLQLTPDELRIKRSDFPKDFAFGVSTSASQIEGATTHGGRGPSVWDYYVKKHPDNVIDKSNMDTAIDSFRRYKEDVQHVKDLGVGVYRFSISWTRILPNGSLKGGVKREGIDHYNSLIDELVKNGIKPLVTLLHFDEPQALQDKYFGLLNRSFAPKSW